MSQGNTRIRSLRQALPAGKDGVRPEHVFEALRDLYGAFAALTQVVPAQFSGQWATPYAIAFDHAPAAVTVASAKRQKEPVWLKNGAVAWHWGGNTIVVDAVQWLIPGASYDVQFLVIG